ncbi:MAG: hypothetical protein A2148_09205 [Chloroflexi bacterium RBG_16_68_14]|nr:MAG: hypothetical protein A2148_09205 [Chloroflexi bacterium RBG_16_68_14]
MKILVPLDKSRRDGIVLPYSVRMAKALEADIAVAHVVSLTRSLVPHAMREAEAYVTAVVAGHQEEGLTVDGFVQRGDPAAVIVTLAGELRADLVIMVTRGRSGLGKFVLGSIASAVLSSCPKPVLLLSEAMNGVLSDGEIRLQSAYLAAVIWHREARGLYSRDEAEEELVRLAKSGLDPDMLLTSYEARGRQSVLFHWLDLDFQVAALRKFFPEVADTWIDRELPLFLGEQAA